MKLFFRKLGNGKPLFILHGLFGSSDNWQTLGKQFAENYTVYFVDQRNHGRSPHSDEHSYQLMSEDLLELMNDENVDKAILMGHSMGGKTVMQFAVNHPGKVEKLVVVDMSPKKYPVTNLEIIQAMEKVDLDKVQSRKEVEEILSQDIKDVGTMQFLLKNLYWTDEQKLAWRFNLHSLKTNLRNVSEITPMPIPPLQMPVLFVKGGKSDHMFNADSRLIHEMFANAKIITIPEAGHWVHADKPKEFYEVMNDFLLEN
ncbi:MAG TPA: alpha/beta fold hydrolase [Bacteroidia bacterium]|jgi:esterase|nr:alpha/beta fold hydrolase [Bacteroidia bacterium]